MSPALVKMDNPIEGRARSCRWETSNTLVTRAERAFAGIAGPPVLCPHNILFGGRKMWAADEMGARGRRDVGQGGGEGAIYVRSTITIRTSGESGRHRLRPWLRRP